jgi:CBS domain-containing protein
MIPATVLLTITPQTPIPDAMKLLQDQNRQELSVVEGDRFVGLVSRNSLARYLRLRQELGLGGDGPPPWSNNQGAA